MELTGTLMSVGQNWTIEPDIYRTTDEEIRVSAFHDPPYIFITRRKNGSHSYDGYLFELWQMLAREAGVRYRMQPLLAGGYGRMDGNGTWTGLTGELAYGRADVALSWLGMIVNRTSVTDFLDVVPVSSFQDRFYVRSGAAGVPQITARTFESLLKPLHSDVWWALLGSLLVISVVLRVSLRLSHGRAETKEMVDGMTWGSCLLSSFRSVVGQGWAASPDSLAARIVTIFSWVLGILLYASYTANLMSHLTVASTYRPIHSLLEFAERDDWKLAMEPGMGILNEWRMSRKQHEQQLFHRVENRDRYIELYPKNQSQLNTDKLLMYADLSRLRYALVRDSCDLTPLLDEPVGTPIPAYIPIAKGKDALRWKLNRAMLAMRETGLVGRLFDRWMMARQQVCDSSAAGSGPLSVTNLLAMLLIVPLAVVFSVAILALELLWSARKSGFVEGSVLTELRKVLAKFPAVKDGPSYKEA